MKEDINISFDNIYPNMEQPNNSDDKMNTKLLDTTSTTQVDPICCNSFCGYLMSCCCFFLYV